MVRGSRARPNRPMSPRKARLEAERDNVVKLPRNKRADARIRQSLNPIMTNSGLVSYHADIRTFTAEASTLQGNGHDFNSMVILCNPKTGREVQFDLVNIDRDRDGDVRAWEFEAKGIKPVIKLTIFND